MQRVRVYLKSGATFDIEADRIDVKLNSAGELTTIHSTNPRTAAEWIRGESIDAVVRISEV